ncbi:MAG: Yip1 family protein [Sphingobium sp.]|jgi:hypothetical protein|nr:YIP1 family protein [Sphingobium sp.]MCP5399240.1 YIP1 family protein [Sphingomonas sp.]
MNTPSNPNPVNLPPGLVDRAKNIVLKPKEEWPVVDAEPASISGLYFKYAMILAAIPAVATFLHAVLFGYGAFGFSYRPGFMTALGMGISQYVMALVGSVIVAFITDFVVTKFDGTANRLNAFKLVIYSSTAAWLVGIFNLIPGLGFLTILGLYSFYLFYVGLPVLMKVPQDKALVCTIVVVVAAIVLSLIAGALMRPASMLFGGPDPMGEYHDTMGGGTVTVPGLGKIETGKLEEASEKVKAIAEGKTEVKAIDPTAMKALLPEKIGGYTRTSVESASMGAAGYSGGQVSADYEMGDKQLEIELVDMSAMGAIAGIGAALNVHQEKESADGFERTFTKDGQMIQEKWNENSKRGYYKKMVAGRFMISVEGNADSFDSLKDMASTIDAGKLAALAE